MENNEGYRASHKGDAVVQNYSDIYSGFRRNGRITDRFSYARWLLEKQELSDYFGERSEFFSTKAYLDFACGSGRLISFLEGYFGKSTGVDISEKMLDVARHECGHSNLLCGDITQEDLLDGLQVDVVTAFRFFLRAEDSLRLAVFAKIHDILADDGLFIFNVHDSMTSLNWPLFLISRIIGKESPVPGAFDLGVRPHFQEPATRRMLKEAGFEVEKVVYLGLVPNMLYGLPFFSKLYYRLDKYLYRFQVCKGLAIERIYYCRKVVSKDGAAREA